MSNENNQSANNAGNNHHNIILIIVALVGAAGTVIAAVLGILGPLMVTNRTINATQTAEARQATLVSTAAVGLLVSPTDTLLPISTGLPTPTLMPTPACPEVKVEYLEFFTLPGQWKQYPSDLEGNILLPREDLGNQDELIGRAKLVNSAGCACAWRGGRQTDHLQTLNTESDCGFLIDVSNGERNEIKVDLELTIGGNRPKLFTISIR